MNEIKATSAISGILVGIWWIAISIAILINIPKVQAATEEAEKDRFYTVTENTGEGTIIVDSETGVCYLWRKYMNAGGLTVMVDADGDPIIWEDKE